MSRLLQLALLLVVSAGHLVEAQTADESGIEAAIRAAVEEALLNSMPEPEPEPVRVSTTYLSRRSCCVHLIYGHVCRTRSPNYLSQSPNPCPTLWRTVQMVSETRSPR